MRLEAPQAVPSCANKNWGKKKPGRLAEQDHIGSTIDFFFRIKIPTPSGLIIQIYCLSLQILLDVTYGKNNALWNVHDSARTSKPRRSFVAVRTGHCSRCTAFASFCISPPTSVWNALSALLRWLSSLKNKTKKQLMSAVGPVQTGSSAKERREADIFTACTWSVVTYELFFSRAGRFSRAPPHPRAEELCVVVFFFFIAFQGPIWGC